MIDIDAQLDQLDQDGFLLIEGALSPEETERCRTRPNAPYFPAPISRKP